MMILVTYDVNTETAAGRKRLRKIAKACENKGQRVQRSVFECLVEPQQWVTLEAELLRIMDENLDSLRVYHLGSHWQGKIENHGLAPAFQQEGTIIL
jgi:CRISPR-associated protein Cas2